MVSQIHTFVTLLLRLVSLLLTVSNISKTKSIMVSFLLHFCFTGYIMLSLCRTNQKVAKVSNCIYLIREYTIAYFCHLLQKFTKQNKKGVHARIYLLSLLSKGYRNIKQKGRNAYMPVFYRNYGITKRWQK